MTTIELIARMQGAYERMSRKNEHRELFRLAANVIVLQQKQLRQHPVTIGYVDATASTQPAVGVVEPSAVSANAQPAPQSV